MDKILELLINDMQNEKPSAEQRLAMKAYCEAERKFMATLNKKQKAEYIELDILTGELSVVEQDDFAKYLYQNLKEVGRS